jgi:hypothetical protein
MHKLYITNLHTKTKRDQKTKEKQILEGYRPSLHLNTSFLLQGKTEKKATKKKNNVQPTVLVLLLLLPPAGS